FCWSYEGPAVSERGGLGRKCDMCHQRLASGEAPACVQACPSEAIRIVVVDKSVVKDRYRTDSGERAVAAKNAFLPSAPEPDITLPTTRYVSAKPLPEDLISGDAHEIQLQPAHWPLVWMLVLSQLAAGA